MLKSELSCFQILAFLGIRAFGIQRYTICTCCHIRNPYSTYLKPRCLKLQFHIAITFMLLLDLSAQYRRDSEQRRHARRDAGHQALLPREEGLHAGGLGHRSPAANGAAKHPGPVHEDRDPVTHNLPWNYRICDEHLAAVDC